MQENPVVFDAEGSKSIVSARSADGNWLLLQREDGTQAWVEAGKVTNATAATAPRQGDSPSNVIPIVEERLVVDREVHETGVVRIKKSPVERTETVRVMTVEETIDIEHVPMNQLLEGPIEVRQEGDTTIIPVMEEVAVVEKRLMLREEIRVTRKRSNVPHEETVTLRGEEVVVERDKPDVHEENQWQTP
jgi:stress response protein YsnF